MDKWQALEKLLNDFHEDVPEYFWLDEEFVLHACHWNGFNFKFANLSLKQNKKFVLKVIKYWGYSFEYADDTLKKDRSFILESVLLNASIINHIDPVLKKDKNFISEVLKTCHLTSEYIDNSFEIK